MFTLELGDHKTNIRGMLMIKDNKAIIDLFSLLYIDSKDENTIINNYRHIASITDLEDIKKISNCDLSPLFDKNFNLIDYYSDNN